MNPLFQQMANQSDFASRFEQFKRSVNGDPQQIIQQMLNRGQITQEQLNAAMQKANEMIRFIK